MASAKAFLLAFLLGISQGLFAQENGRLSNLESYLFKASALDLHHQVLDSASVAYRLGLSTPEFHKIYGWALYNTNRPLRAAAQYRKALSLNSLDTVAQLGLYQALRDGGEQQEAHFYRRNAELKDNGSRHISVEGILTTGTNPNFGTTFIPDSAGAANSAWQNSITGINIGGQFPLSKRLFFSFGVGNLSVGRSSMMQGIELVLKDSVFNPALGRFQRNYSLDTLSNIQRMGITQNQGMVNFSYRMAKNLMLQLQYQLIDVQATFQSLNFFEESFQFQPFDVLPSVRIRHDFNFRNERFQDHVLLAGFHWRWNRIKWLVAAGIRSFYGSNAPLLNVEMVWNPLGNPNLYLIPGINTDFSSQVISMQAGVRLLASTWLESQFFLGNLTGLVSNGGAIVWNLPDNTQKRFTLNLIRKISGWGEWSLRYGYTELETSRTAYQLGGISRVEPFNYQLHSFVTGFKFFF